MIKSPKLFMEKLWRFHLLRHNFCKYTSSIRWHHHKSNVISWSLYISCKKKKIQTGTIRSTVNNGKRGCSRATGLKLWIWNYENHMNPIHGLDKLCIQLTAAFNFNITDGKMWNWSFGTCFQYICIGI
jgi:hypothetical protein